MLDGPPRLSVLAALLAFGATGIALALTGAGLPFVLAAALGAVAVGLVMFAALRRASAPAQALTMDRKAELAAAADLDRFRAETATLRHDLRGVLSPALMMTDRLMNHTDPAVQRAGKAVLRSIERATALLATNRKTLQAPAPEPAAMPPMADGAGPRPG